jgi:adenosylcobinamide amidohydrolase
MFAISGSPQYALIRFYEPISCLSWAPFGGGFRQSIKYFLNRTLPKDTIEPLPAIIGNLKAFITDLKIDSDKTVAMVTTVSQQYLGTASQENRNGFKIWAIATVGLGNTVAPGEHTAYDEELDQPPPVAGTINIMLALNRNLSPNAALELSSVITLAKASVLADLNLKSRRNGKLCLATGTDCNAVCWDPNSEITLNYAGLHTRLAELTTNTVRTAMVKSLSLRLNVPYQEDQEIISLATSRFSATR